VTDPDGQTSIGKKGILKVAFPQRQAMTSWNVQQDRAQQDPEDTDIDDDNSSQKKNSSKGKRGRAQGQRPQVNNGQNPPPLPTALPPPSRRI